MRVLDLFAGLGGWSAVARERGHDVCTTDLDPRFGCDITADALELDPDDVRDVLGGDPDLVLASPPCEAFSVLTIGRNWGAAASGLPRAEWHTPKTEAAALAIRLVQRTRELIAELQPAYFVIENPRAKLRKLPVLADLERRTVTYCQYGEPFKKPTDLWGGFPPSLELRPKCVTTDEMVTLDGITYVLDLDGEPCHVSAPRGSTTGIQSDSGGRLTGLYDAHYQRLERSIRAGRLTPHKAVTRAVLGTNNKATLAALRARIPAALAGDVIEAAEVDLADGRAAVRATLF